jgi:hypothetical protein
MVISFEGGGAKMYGLLAELRCSGLYLFPSKGLCRSVVEPELQGAEIIGRSRKWSRFIKSRSGSR